MPAYGEMPVEDDVDEQAAAFVVAGEMAAHEPIVETPVSYFVPEPEDEAEAPLQADPAAWAEIHAFEPEVAISPDPNPSSGRGTACRASAARARPVAARGTRA